MFSFYIVIFLWILCLLRTFCSLSHKLACGAIAHEHNVQSVLWLCKALSVGSVVGYGTYAIVSRDAIHCSGSLHKIDGDGRAKHIALLIYLSRYATLILHCHIIDIEFHCYCCSAIDIRKPLGAYSFCFSSRDIARAAFVVVAHVAAPCVDT